MIETLSSAFYNVFAGIRIRDIIDILIIAFAVYKILGFIRETRAKQLVKGLLFLVLATIISGYLDLFTINYILKRFMAWGFVAIVIVFQPELRRGLEHLGRSKFLSKQFAIIEREEAKTMVTEIGEAIELFSSNRIGALIIFERQTSLSSVGETGTLVDGEVTGRLLQSLFYPGTPLHDGAVIIRGDRVYAAGCVLPLTTNKELDKSLGTRHRAGIGITEHSDALALIVSEETGIISMASDGKLSRFLDKKTVEKQLFKILWEDIESSDSLMPFLKSLNRRKDND